MSTVYLPVARERALRLAAGEDYSGTAYGVTDALRAAHGLGPVDDEEAEVTALWYAGLAAALSLPTPRQPAGPRLVLAADVAAAQVTDAGGPFGELGVTGLRWTQVTALFADEPAGVPTVDQARALAAGADLATAADRTDVEALLADADLLWFAPEEIGRLP